MSPLQPTGSSTGGRPIDAAAATRRQSTRLNLGKIVRGRILDDIWAGRWRPGDRLPTETELMTLFGVSRTPIREAMQSLNLLGVVEISPRRGATVRALSIESVVNLAILSGVMAPERSVRDIFDFRQATEGSIAFLAATNATPSQISSIHDLLAENERAVFQFDREMAKDVDVRFHAAIADASSNVVFRAVAQALTGLLNEQRQITGGIPGASEAALDEHRAILAAITAKNPAAARREAQSHIERTRRRYESTRRGTPAKKAVLAREP